jgi:peptidoglycan/LPS O-acetylase OafA/YrhL
MLALDVVAVLLFAAVGRRSHTEGVTVVGVLDTAWPFLAGVVAGWLVTRAWRRAASLVPVGVAVWIAAVVVGMLLRRLTGDGPAWSFVAVATVVLGLLLLGWRSVARFVARLTHGRGADAASWAEHS